LYDVLGVPRDADGDAIRRAFRSRARKLHPDISDDPNAGEAFRELTQAYEVLSKPQTRRLYDRFGLQFARLEDAARLSADVHVELEVDAFRAARGGRERFTIEDVESCARCSGAGSVTTPQARPCSACDGRGWIRGGESSTENGLLRIETCASCRGTGEVGRTPCAACDGGGITTATRRLQVRLPPRTRNGHRIHVEGAGRSAGDQRGDVWVTVRVKPLPADSRLVAYVALAALACAIVLLVLVLAVAPV
jgi:molecular chaperone DnaJ